MKTSKTFSIHFWLKTTKRKGNLAPIYASYQRLRQEVIYKHKMPYSITDGKSRCFVFVIPKFVLGDNEKLMLELKELKGSRKVVLETRL